MKILIISPVNPFYQISGDQIRIFQFIKFLSNRNFVKLIHLNSYTNNIDYRNSNAEEIINVPIIKTNHYDNKLFSIIKWLLSSKTYKTVKFYNKNFKYLIKNELYSQFYDCVIFNGTETLQYSTDIVKHKNSIFILDQHNDDHSWFKSFTTSNKVSFRLYGYLNLFRLRKSNKKIFDNLDIIFSVSKKDRVNTINSSIKNIDPIVVPNGVDLNFFKNNKPIHFPSTYNIIFCGSMDVSMNQEAVLHFVSSILPIVKNRFSNTKFYIVGKNPSQNILKLNNDADIIVTGYVSDVRPYYELATVSVAPFRIGGGTKLKILESMAMKIPIVSSIIGVQGIEVEDDFHLLIAKNDSEFAMKIIKLFNNNNSRLTNNAYDLVKSHYSWYSIVHAAEHSIRNFQLN